MSLTFTNYRVTEQDGDYVTVVAYCVEKGEDASATLCTRESATREPLGPLFVRAAKKFKRLC